MKPDWERFIYLRAKESEHTATFLTKTQENIEKGKLKTF